MCLYIEKHNTDQLAVARTKEEEKLASRTSPYYLEIKNTSSLQCNAYACRNRHLLARSPIT